MVPLTPARIGVGYGAALGVFLTLDTGWITLIASPFHRQRIQSIVVDRASVPAAIGFYLLNMAGLVYFAVAPGLRADSWILALLFGAIYGFFAHVAYTLTDFSVLRAWNNLVAAGNIGWGVVVSALTAVASLFITRWTVG